MNDKMQLNNRLVKFIAVAFPGGYKFFAVMLITNFSSEAVAKLFSEGFFWVLLFLTFSGIPIAAMMSSRTEILTDKQKYTIVLSSTLILLLTSLFFFSNHTNTQLIINIAFASIFVSIYEFIRKDFFNDECFTEIFVAGCISVILLLAVFFLFSSYNEYILAFSMFCMLVPAWILHCVKNYEVEEKSKIRGKRLISVFIQYCISNGFSTSLAAILPLLLIPEIGDDYSVVMAQVVALSKMLLLVPKAMAASNIPKLRNHGSLWKIVKPYCKVLNVYFIILAIFCAPLSWFYGSNDAILFYFLLLSIQISQLALPYSNVLAVEGKSRELLIANIKGTFIFFLSIAPIYFFMEQSYERGLVIIILYFIHNFIKFQLTKFASLEFIK